MLLSVQFPSLPIGGSFFGHLSLVSLDCRTKASQEHGCKLGNGSDTEMFCHVAVKDECGNWIGGKERNRSFHLVGTRNVRTLGAV
jgi:hypothetical protein